MRFDTHLNAAVVETHWTGLGIPRRKPVPATAPGSKETEDTELPALRSRRSSS